MKRALLVVLVVAGTAQTLAASSRPSNAKVASTFPNDERTPTAPIANLSRQQSAISERTMSPPYVRFGSGLEDDAPHFKPNVFLQSGLEDAISPTPPKPESALLKFGSGLEDDAPFRKPNVLLQSGLEESTAGRSERNRVANVKFGSGLEDEATRYRPKSWYHPGF